MEKWNSYQKWADIVKGIGILLVVLGHSGNSFYDIINKNDIKLKLPLDSYLYIC